MKVFDYLKKQSGSILLSVFIVNIIALMVAMLITDIAIEQMRTTYRNISSSSALAVSQAGLEDALGEFTMMEARLATNLANGVPTAQSDFDAWLDGVIANGKTCSFQSWDSNINCKWWVSQDSVIGTIKKDSAVTYDITQLAQKGPSNPVSYLWECSAISNSGSAMVITYISESGGEFLISNGGKQAVKCSTASGNIEYTAVTAQSLGIGPGDGLINAGVYTSMIPPDARYLRIRAVGNDVKYLRIVSSTAIPIDTNSYLTYGAGAGPSRSGKTFPFRDVITSKGDDNVSRYSKIARSRDLNVPALFDFVLFTEGSITK